MRGRRHALAWGLLCWLGGCAGAPGHAVTGSQHAGSKAVTPAVPKVVGWQGRQDALSERMREIEAGMARAGLHPLAFERKGFIPAGSRHTFEVQVPAGRCHTWATLTSAGVRDVDATLYAPDGQVLAEDNQPDAHPTIQACGGSQPLRAYLTLHAYEGAGAFLLAGFSGSPADLEAAARVVGGRPGVAKAILDEDEEQQRLHAFSQGVHRRGFRSLRAPFRVALHAGPGLRFGVPVKGGQCYTVAAFAADGLVGVNLRVLDEAGIEIVRDMNETKTPAVQFCAERGSDFAAELHVVEGAGDVMVVVFSASAARVGGPNGLWLGTRSDALPIHASLEEVLKRQSERAKAMGDAVPQVVVEGALQPGEAVAHAVRLTQGRCTRIRAVGGRGIARLALYVRGDDGGEIVGQPSEHGVVEAEACSAASAEVEVIVVARSGHGAYALVTSGN